MPMLAIFQQVLAYIFRFILLKGILIASLFIILAFAIPLVFSLLDLCCELNVQSLNQIFSLMPSEVWFWLNLFNFSYGFQIVFSAVLIKFMLGFIPWINQ